MMNQLEQRGFGVYPLCHLPHLLLVAAFPFLQGSLRAQTNCTPPPSGQVSWWRAEGNALDQVGGNNGYASNVTFAAGEVGQAFSLNGTNSYIRVPDNSTLHFTNALTIEGWVFPTTLGLYQQMLSKWDGVANTHQKSYGVVLTPDGRIYVTVCPTGDDSVIPAPILLTTNSIPTNAWTHFAATYDGAALNIYLDGAWQNQLAYTNGIFPGTNDFGIGGTIGGLPPGQVSFPFAGELDEISLYSRALSAAEILAIYNAGSAGKCAGPSPPAILHQPTNQFAIVGGTASFAVLASGAIPLTYQWLFYGTNLPSATNSFLTLTNLQLAQVGLYAVTLSNIYGSTLSSNAVLEVDAQGCAPLPSGLVSWWPANGSALDIVGQNNGTLVNGATFAPGEVRQAFVFNGINQVVQVPDAPSLNPTAALTLEGWVNVTAFSANNATAVAGKDNPYGSRQYVIGMANISGLWVFRAHIGVSSGFQFFNGATALQTNTWYHVAMTYDGAYLLLYVNGVPDGNLAVTGPVITSSEALLIGGSVPGPWDFNGRIDELSLYNRALSLSEVQSIFTAGSAGKCATPTPPLIVLQPTNRTVTAGSIVTLAGIADGTGPLTYQWLLNGTNLAGATSPSLTLTNAPLSQAGVYSLLVTNAYGSALSSNALLTINPTCAPPPAGLVGWWQGEVSGLDAVSGTSAVIQGGVQFTPGEVGQAFVLNGANADLQIPASSNLNVGAGGGLTLEAWILPTNSAQESVLLEWNNGAGFIGTHFAIAVPILNGGAGSLYANLIEQSGTAHPISTPAGLVQSGAFQHVALTYDKVSGIASIFLNGTVVAQTNLGSFTPYTASDLYLGYRASGPFTGLRFQGVMDEVSVYARALSSTEIAVLSNSGTAGKCPLVPVVLTQPTSQTVSLGDNTTFTVISSGSAPISYQWSLNGTKISAATNSTLTLTNIQLSQAGLYAVTITNLGGTVLSSNALLTVNVATACTAPPTNLISWWRAESNALDQVSGNNGSLVGKATYAPAEVGTGFTFNDAGDAVQIGNPPDLQLQNFTIEGWIRRASTTVASQNDPNTGLFFGCTWGGYGVGLWNDGRLFLGKVGYSSISSTNTITDLNFHHFAVAKSGSTIQLYIDAVGETTGPYDPGFVFNGPSAIGARGSDFVSGFFGAVDELSIYSWALSSSEIKAIYDAGTFGKCVVPVSPFFIAQPTSRTITAGTNLTLNAVAAGSAPLNYQWQFNGASLIGATNASLILSNVTIGEAGNYSVLVTNSAGSVTSTNALLTVTFPPASILIANTTVNSGSIAALPVVIVANGNENALGLSLSFNTNLLTYAGVSSGISGANLTPNTSLINSGKLGLIFSLPPGATLGAGPQQILQVSFSTAVITTNGTAAVSFGDQPTARQLLDSQLNTLPATYANGTVNIAAATAFEGDVFPRPNGEMSLGLDDWLQMGRFVARLDYPTNAYEFQRADCAPRSTLGDGALRIDDWVQVGRYVAGLDPMTPAGGPTNELSIPGPGASTNRLLEVSTVALGPGQPFTTSVTLLAQGNENAAGFSLSFDPSLAIFVGATLGSDATSATLYFNTNQVGSGNIGFALALGTGSSFTAGPRELVRLNFQSSSTVSGTFAAALTDQPVPRSIADAGANALPVGFVNGSVTVYPPPGLTIGRSGTNVTLGWPLWATNFSLQEAKGALPPFAFWSNILTAPAFTNNQNLITIPLGPGPNFFRLSK